MKTVRQAAGALMVVGLCGTGLTALERAWMKLVRPGGVILFRRNIAGAAQTRALLADATTLCASHAFRCVDVEGGTVDRLRDALARTPSAQAVARAGLAREHGRLIAQGVRAFGFNTTLSPVLDLGLPASAEVMGTRCAGATAAEVTAYAREFLAGLAEHGVAGCGKHFPGLGAGTRDSHTETPAIERTWEELWREDLEPYRALSAALPMVMVSHAAYPRTRGARQPASVSRFWMTEVLLGKLKYRGVIFSDDLEMGGILKFMPMEEAAVEAIRAGMDTIEVCHSAELILRAYEALVREGERSAAFATLLLTRARAMERKRRALFGRGAAPGRSAKQFEALRTKIAQLNERVARTGEDAPRGARALVETA